MKVQISTLDENCLPKRSKGLEIENILIWNAVKNCSAHGACYPFNHFSTDFVYYYHSVKIFQELTFYVYIPQLKRKKIKQFEFSN